MNKKLLFRFIAADQVEWLVENGGLTQGTLADVAVRARGRPLLLVVPGETVTLTQAKVPSRNRAARLKAVPYALEEHLADDVGDLHFAVGDVSAGVETPVAVVRRGVLASWLDTCAQAGVAPGAAVPDSLLLPFGADAWSVLLEDDRAVVRTGPWTGFATERENLGLLLKLALVEAGDDAPRCLRVWGNTPPELAELNVDIRSQDAGLAPLQVLAGGQGATTLNLLQGPYSRTAQLGKWLRPWRAAAILAGLWLGLQVALQVAEYRQLHHEQVALRQAMEQVYKDAVPTARKIVNPRAQLENRLRELGQGTGAGQAVFLDLLYQGTVTLMDFKDVTLRGIRYKTDQLNLDLEGGSLETLDQLKQRLLEQANLSAEVRTTKREGKVESQITLRRSAL